MKDKIRTGRWGRERRQKGGLKWGLRKGKGEGARDRKLLEIKYEVVLFSTKNKN